MRTLFIIFILTGVHSQPTPSPPTPSPPTPSPPTPSPPTPSPPTPSPPTPSPTTANPLVTQSPPTPSPPTPSPTTANPLATPSPPTPSPATPAPTTVSPLTASPDATLPPPTLTPTLPPPTPSPGTLTPGTLDSPVISIIENDLYTVVKIDAATPGSKVYYTLDGSDPNLPSVNSASSVYTSELVIRQTGVIVRAVSWKEGVLNGPFSTPSSAVVSVVDLMDPPVFTPPERAQLTGTIVSIATSTNDTTQEQIIYTRCSAEVCVSPLLASSGATTANTYTFAPILLDVPGVVSLAAVTIAKDGSATNGVVRRPSTVTHITYDVALRCKPPVLLSQSGRYVSSLTLRVAQPVDGCRIEYMFETASDAGSYRAYAFDSPPGLSLVGNYTAVVVARQGGYVDSELVSAVYVIVPVAQVVAARVQIDESTSLSAKSEDFRAKVAANLGVATSRVQMLATDRDEAADAVDTMIFRFAFTPAPSVSAEEKSEEFLSRQFLALPDANLKALGVESVWKDGGAIPTLAPRDDDDDGLFSARNILIAALALVCLLILLGVLWFCCKKKPAAAATTEPSHEPIHEKDLHSWEEEQRRREKEVPLLEAAPPRPYEPAPQQVVSPVEVVEQRQPAPVGGPLPPPPVTYGKTFARPHEYSPLPLPPPMAPQPMPSVVAGSPVLSHHPSGARFTTPPHPDGTSAVVASPLQLQGSPPSLGTVYNTPYPSQMQLQQPHPTLGLYSQI